MWLASQDAIRKWCIFLSLILVLPALLVNLDLTALFEDEAMRALVALEMLDSSNFWVPTLNGELYFRKPGLYNWILIFFSRMTGSMTIWTIRFPTVLFLLIYGYIVYHFAKKHYTKEQSILLGFMLVTCGRFLFWDSMIGLIDTLFSAVVFLNFMLIYHYGKKEKIYHMMILSYIICGIAFLLKTLPALVFQGVTLLVWAVMQKRLRVLWHPAHFLGIGLLFLVLGGYFYNYHIHGGDLSTFLQVTFHESSHRTAAEQPFTKTLKHLLIFPFDVLFVHFVPWTLFIFYIRKDFWNVLAKNDFLKYCFFVFVFNLIPYWFSPGVFPRHLLMFPPLLYFVLYSMYLQRKEKERTSSSSMLVLLVLSILFVLHSAVLISGKYSSFQPILLLFAILFLMLTLVTWKNRSSAIIILVVGLLIARIEYDIIVIPEKAKELYSTKVKTDMYELASSYPNEKLVITGREDTYKDHSFYMNSYYWATKTDNIVLRENPEEWTSDKIYFIDRIVYPDYESKFDIIDSSAVMWKRSWMPIGRLKSEEMKP